MLVAVILLLLAAVYGYLAMRKYQSYRDCIHADAAFIVKIDADQLYRTLVFDYLSNSSHYKGHKAGKLKTGLDVPANVFIYTVYPKSFQTWFCSLPVADTALLKQFIRKRLGISVFKNNGKYLTGASANGRLFVAFNNQTFAASYSLKKENTGDVLADLLNKQNLLSDQDPKIKKLKAIDTHLGYVFEMYTGSGEFKKGMLHVQGDFNFKALKAEGKVFSHRVFDKNAVLKMWLNAQLATDGSLAEIQVKDHTIYPDSLLKYYKGYFDTELNSPVAQADTVITYQYNDDFEKEEILTPRMLKVPGINARISANGAGLLSHLKKEGILINARVNKQVFPLYELYAKGSNAAFMLSTNKHAVFSDHREESPYFFYLEADFNKFRAQGQFPLLESYTKQFNKLLVKAMNEKSGSKQFELVLYFKFKHINALGQLF